MDIVVQDKTKRTPLIFLKVLIFLAGLIFVVWLNSSGAADFRSYIREFILKELVHLNPLHPGQAADVAYVLGGSQRSLEFKYETVGEFYRKGLVGKVWILSRKGITEFSHEAGRNLTYDEWSIRELEKLGVPENKIELVTIDEGFFGTLSEAKKVSDLIRQRALKTLFLISEPYHSQRVNVSFKKFMPPGTILYIQSSSNTQRLYETLIELIKLIVYENWLL